MLDFLRYGLFIRIESALADARDREEGQALVEYALILALVSVVAIGTLQALGTNVVARLGDVVTALAGAAGGAG
jgi:pilus assembly protein Flp/PilA